MSGKDLAEATRIAFGPTSTALAYAWFDAEGAKLERVKIGPDPSQDFVERAANWLRFLPSNELIAFYDAREWWHPSASTPEALATALIQEVEDGIAEERRVIAPKLQMCGGPVRAVIVDALGARYFAKPAGG